MIRSLFVLILPAALIFSCGQRQQDRAGYPEEMIVRVEALELLLPDAERSFLDNLAGLCGKSYRGKEIYSAPGRESWAQKDFVMHVTVCEHDKVHIPFHLDQDHSRTWMFLTDGNRLRFRHDHRHDDGTPEDLTLYGGYSDGTGTAFIQKFPADDYTIELLEDTLGREWVIILDEDMSSMTYQLHYSGQLMFAAEFNLTDPL